MKNKIILCTLLLLLSNFALAVPVVLEFSSSGENRMDPYTEDGVLMTVNSGHYDFLSAGSPGFGYLNIDPAGPFPISSVRFQLESGIGSFDILSFDIVDEPRLGTAVFSSSESDYLEITAPGHYEFSGSDWSNLTWMDFSTHDGYAGIDNLVLDIHAVPEPSPLVLILLSLGALLVSKRQKLNTISL